MDTQEVEERTKFVREINDMTGENVVVGLSADGQRVEVRNGFGSENVTEFPYEKAEFLKAMVDSAHQLGVDDMDTVVSM